MPALIRPSHRAPAAALVVVVGVGVVVVAGCAPVADLGQVALKIWQPSDVADSQIDDAARVSITALIDVVGTTHDFDHGERIVLPDLRTDVAGGVVELIVKTEGGSLSSAVARTGVVQVAGRIEGAAPPVVDAPAVLAPPDELHVLDADLPHALVGSAMCAGDDGRVVVVSGGLGGAAQNGSFVVDPVARAVRVGPGLTPGRVGAACVVDGERTWLFAGCDAVEGAPVTSLARADGDDAFAHVVDIDAGGGCGAAGSRAGDALLLQSGATLVRVGADGDARATTTLPEARYGATLAVLATAPPRFLLAGGVDLDGTPVTMALLVTVDGDDLVVAAALVSPAVASPTGALAIVDDRVVRLDAAGGEAATLVDVPADITPGALAALPDDGAAILSLDGAQLVVLVAGEATMLTLPEPRPGARLLVDAGGAIRVVGGGVSGVLVVVHGG